MTTAGPGAAAGGPVAGGPVAGGSVAGGPVAGGPAAPSAGAASAAAPRPASAAKPAAKPGAKSGGSSKPARSTRPPRLASLQLKRLDPWTTLKISLIVSIVMFFVWMIAVGVLYLSLDTLGVWEKINETYNTLVVSPESTEATSDLITPGTVFGVTAVVGAINIVLFTALSAIFAFIYNAAAGMAGGVEVTLAERD